MYQDHIFTEASPCEKVDHNTNECQIGSYLEYRNQTKQLSITIEYIHVCEFELQLKLVG